MHPAPSIITFTVLSGLGFGLMVWLGLGAVDVEGWIAATFCLMALGLAGGGLLSSLFHLGHPERAPKALTQWRSSWLSREGILAIVTMLLFTLFSLIWVFGGVRSGPLGALAALAALATVFSTAMIYTQMKTVPRWHSPLTPVVFLLASLSGGALLAGMTASFWIILSLGVVLILDSVQGEGRFSRANGNIATATGLGKFGRLRQLAPPHTGQNYLLKEMVYVIGRKHAHKINIIGMTLAIPVPLFLIGVFHNGHTTFGLAVVSHITGMVLLRWLFFARAEHVVGIYYGKH